MRTSLPIKYLVILFSCVLLIGKSANLKAQWVVLPQTPFQDSLKAWYPSCVVLDGVTLELKMDTSCSAILTEDSLLFYSTPSASINLEGIQYFKGLNFLHITSSQSLISPRLPGGLKRFSYSAGSLTSYIPPLNTDLRSLLVINSLGSTLTDPLPDSLRFLYLSGNRFASIPSLPARLDTLVCINQTVTSLTSLPTLPATLKWLKCSEIGLQSFPQLPASLIQLDCNNNYRYNNGMREFTLTALPDLPSGLEVLNCRDNKLQSLPTLPTSLKKLDCSNQRWFKGELNSSSDANLVYPGLSNLPALPPTLQELRCAGNNLRDLPSVLPASLITLDLNYNVKQFNTTNTTEGITCLPVLPPSLTYINTLGTLIRCFPNSGALPYSAMPPRPLCSPLNNVNQCTAFPIISGTTFLDLNSNGVRDIGENPKPNVELQSSSGFSAYSDLNGNFELTADTGISAITVLAPIPFISVPPASTFTFSSFDTSVNKLFALQPSRILDSINIVLIPQSAARPGFPTSYTVFYENVGSANISSTFQIRYDDLNLIYQGASISGVVENGGLITSPAISTVPGQRASFSIGFLVKSNAQLGDTIVNVLSTIVNSSIVSDTSYAIIRGSFDPNDKSATPSLTPAQVIEGAYVDYLIRFQNTGTDTAFNVIIADTLSTLVDASSFQLIATSHNVKAKRNGSYLFFEFINILLPDSNVNEIASHGWIRFRVKPISTIPLNSVIPNSAAIYFDYNPPVITNVANTSISFSTLPLKLVSFGGYVDDRNNAILQWKTEDELNVESFVIEKAWDGLHFQMTSTVLSKGSGGHLYRETVRMNNPVEYFRLKMKDTDGVTAYSPVIRLQYRVIDMGFVLLNNPVDNELKMEIINPSLQNAYAVITDATGRLFKRFIVGRGIQKINISSLPPGTYFVRINDKGTSFLIVR